MPTENNLATEEVPFYSSFQFYGAGGANNHYDIQPKKSGRYIQQNQENEFRGEEIHDILSQKQTQHPQSRSKVINNNGGPTNLPKKVFTDDNFPIEAPQMLVCQTDVGEKKKANKAQQQAFNNFFQSNDNPSQIAGASLLNLAQKQKVNTKEGESKVLKEIDMLSLSQMMMDKQAQESLNQSKLKSKNNMIF